MITDFVGSKMFSAGFWDDLVQCFRDLVFPGSLIPQMETKRNIFHKRKCHLAHWIVWNGKGNIYLIQI